MEIWEFDPNKRALAIVRISSKGQEGNTSPESQKKDIKSYCQGVGLDLIKCQSIIESAKNSEDRKKYHKLFHWAQAEGIKHIVFHRNDREARNMTDLEKTEQLIREGTLTIHYALDKKVLHEGSSDSDFFNREIQGVMNKHFSRELSSKVKRGMRAKAEKGWFPSNNPPLGYSTQKQKKQSIVIVDPNERNVRQVQREFELRAKGYSYGQIAETIISEGFTKVRGYNGSTVQARITNIFYRGHFIWEGKEYSGNHPLIVSETILKRVDRINGQRGTVTKRAMGEGIFSNWLTCATPECGKKIIYDPKVKTIKSTGEKRTHHYYHCSNSRKVHETMKGMNITEEKLFEQFEPAVNVISITELFARDIANALNEANEKKKEATKKQIGAFKRALLGLDKHEDEAYEDFKNGIIDGRIYRRRIQQVRKRRYYFTDRMEQAELTLQDGFNETAKSILELAIDAKKLWKKQNRTERLEYLKKVCSNPVLDGVTVRYDLQKPYSVIAKMKGNTNWHALEDSNLKPPP